MINHNLQPDVKEDNSPSLGGGEGMGETPIGATPSFQEVANLNSIPPQILNRVMKNEK